MERKEQWQWAAWIIVPCLAAGIFWYFSPMQRAARMCDEAVQSELKAPSTYRRISIDSDTLGDPPSLRLTYEAANSFGVPIRSDGYCILSKDLQSATMSRGLGDFIQ